ncbi:MAG: hypothetical protein ABSB74_16320 [Tepidisphaeraceae bacterium]
MTPACPRQKGLAMVTAIFLVSLVTMTLTVLIAGVVGEARRTQMLSEDAQLRQLLLAGTEIARSQLPAEAQTGQLPVTLPNSLRQAGAALTITIQSRQSPDDVQIEIEASLPRHRMTDRIHLTRATAEWQVVSSALGD